MKHILICVLMLFYGIAFSQSVETVGTPEFDIRDEFNNDYNLIRTDQDGNIIWSRAITESNNPFDLSQGTYIVYGFTEVVKGKIIDNPCDYDYWVVRVVGDVDIQIYPNPASREIKVTLNSFTDNLMFDLYDVHLRLLKSYILDNYITEITLPNLSDGIYLYNVISNNKLIKTGKVCIMQKD